MDARRATALVLTSLVMVSACDAGTSHGRSRAVTHVRLKDGVGDVFLSSSDDTDEVARTVRNVDIVATDIRRTGGDLQVTVAYHDLAARASRSWDASFNVVTSRAHFTYVVLWEAGQYADTGAAYRGVSVVKTTSEDSFGDPCPRLTAKGRGATAKVDYNADQVTITVPDSCLGSPAWMRLDDLATRSKAPHGVNDYSDNPFNATGTSESTPRLVAPAH
jgi:hypothetical protein